MYIYIYTLLTTDRCYHTAVIITISHTRLRARDTHKNPTGAFSLFRQVSQRGHARDDRRRRVQEALARDLEPLIHCYIMFTLPTCSRVGRPKRMRLYTYL